MIRPLNLDPHKSSSFSQQAKLRQSAADYFFVYCRQVLPRMEEKIEMQLLEKFKDSLASEAERKEVHTAYLQRKDNLAKLAEVQELGQREKREESLQIPADEIARVIMSAEGDGLSYHTFEDIGRYTVFPKKHWERMFPDKQFFGNYNSDEFQYNHTFGVMTREEGLRITNDLARLRLPSERSVDYNAILGLETGAQVKEAVLKDEERFFAVQQDFSLFLNDYLEQGISKEPLEYQQSVRRLFQSPAVFDSVVAILVQELRMKPMRYHLCQSAARTAVIDQLVRKLHDKMIEKKLNPQKLGEIIEHMPLVVLDLERKNLTGSAVELQKNDVHHYKLYLSGYHKICTGLWRPEDMRRVSLPRFKGGNSGLLLWGDRGAGKSQILTYVSAWAHENRWAVINVPKAEAFVDGS